MSADPGVATSLYASIGNKLTHYRLKVERALLERRDTAALPQNVQYAWPHPAQPCLYVVCSNGSPESRGDTHCMVSFRIDGCGALSVHGEGVSLPARPIHVTVDIAGRHLLVAYNDPSSITVHRIRADGTIGEAVSQAPEPDTGVYAHQVRVAPSNAAVVVVARGNDAKPPRGEDPGALKVFDYAAGRLSTRASIAPGSGFGFGPRHIDFHPTEPWVYVSLERQNKLLMFRAPQDVLEPGPAFARETLAESPGVGLRQRAGTLHVHPNGRYAYVANRASGTHAVDGKNAFVGGENNIAVYRIDGWDPLESTCRHASLSIL